jgi:hypothetical protein
VLLVFLLLVRGPLILPLLLTSALILRFLSLLLLFPRRQMIVNLVVIFIG